MGRGDNANQNTLSVWSSSLRQLSPPPFPAVARSAPQKEAALETSIPATSIQGMELRGFVTWRKFSRTLARYH
jgi:hypothetical protein